LVACNKGARTREEAVTRLTAAVDHEDAAAAYPLLDQDTRWSIESTRKYHAECLALIGEAYPPAAQAAARARFLDASSAARFLALHEARYHLLRNAKTGPSGLTPSLFVEGPDHRWGYTGLRSTWEELKQRAVHDVETVRDSADAYRKAQR
jgi:hypothetical protein